MWIPLLFWWILHFWISWDVPEIKLVVWGGICGRLEAYIGYKGDIKSKVVQLELFRRNWGRHHIMELVENEKRAHSVLKQVQYQFFPLRHFQVWIFLETITSPRGEWKDILLNENASFPEIYTFMGLNKQTRNRFWWSIIFPPSEMVTSELFRSLLK